MRKQDYQDIFIADVSIVGKPTPGGWVEVKDKKGKKYSLTAFGSKVVSPKRKHYSLWVRETDVLTFYHLR